HKNYTGEKGDLPFFSSNIGPAKAGVQKCFEWIPADPGMTKKGAVFVVMAKKGKMDFPPSGQRIK
ncbi:MAG: hypothetical protein M0009_07275, partial [Deltaproteobacteria bacterium]|nr:hypothetical protein [Deltaproteobacteria bacterium]